MTIEQINRELTQLFKDDIIRKDLVDTGLLRDTINVEVTFTNDEWGLDITSQDYFVYLDVPYDITTDVMNTTRFNELVDEIHLHFLKKQINDGIFN